MYYKQIIYFILLHHLVIQSHLGLCIQDKQVYKQFVHLKYEIYLKASNFHINKFYKRKKYNMPAYKK